MTKHSHALVRSILLRMERKSREALHFFIRACSKSGRCGTQSFACAASKSPLPLAPTLLDSSDSASSGSKSLSCALCHYQFRVRESLRRCYAKFLNLLLERDPRSLASRNHRVHEACRAKLLKSVDRHKRQVGPLFKLTLIDLHFMKIENHSLTFWAFLLLALFLLFAVGQSRSPGLREEAQAW